MQEGKNRLRRENKINRGRIARRLAGYLSLEKIGLPSVSIRNFSRRGGGAGGSLLRAVFSARLSSPTPRRRDLRQGAARLPGETDRLGRCRKICIFHAEEWPSPTRLYFMHEFFEIARDSSSPPSGTGGAGGPPRPRNDSMMKFLSSRKLG